MASIVVIHGMNQNYQSELELQAQIRLAIVSGCRAALRNGSAGKEPDERLVTLAFYGDLFRDPPRPIDTKRVGILSRQPPDPEDAPLSREEEQTAVAIFEARKEAGTGDPGSASASAAEADETPGPDTRAARKADPRVVMLLGQMLDAAGQSKTAEYVVRNHIKQLHRYLNVPEKGREVLDRVAPMLTEDTKLVIGHSMGTLIAFELLSKLPEGRGLTLITLGSPIAIPYVYMSSRFGDGGRIAKKPASIGRWVNIVDPRDPVSPIHDLSGAFADPQGVPQTPIYVNNGRGVHELPRFLNAAETGAEVLASLQAT